jgi:Na+/H+-dicarboxylate symporter
MLRTSVNITGDCAVATIIASSENEIKSEEEVNRLKKEERLQN